MRTAIQCYSENATGVEHRDLQAEKGIEPQLHICLSSAEPTYVILGKVSPVSSAADCFTKLKGTTGISLLLRTHCSDNS